MRHLKFILVAFMILLASKIYSQTINPYDSWTNSLFNYVQVSDYEGVKNSLYRGAMINAYDEDGYTPIMYAADNCNLQIIKLLMDSGANPNLNPLYDHEPPSLHAAVLRNNPDAVDLLLQYDITDVNLKDSLGQTALYLAVYYGYYDCAKILISHHANPNITLPNATLLQIVAYYDDIKMMNLFVDNVDVNEICNNRTAFSVAVETGNLDFADSLVKHGVDINASKPVFCSSAFADSSSLSYLKDVNSDLECVDSERNFSACDYSIFYNNFDNYRKLKELGIHPKQKFMFKKFTISEINEVAKHEGRIGLQFGIHELRYNFALYFGLNTRLSYKSSLNCFEDNNVYYQLREKRKSVYLNLEKRFAFSRSVKYDFGALLAYQLSFSNAKFDGSIDNKPESQNFHSPCVGLYYRYAFAGISAGYKYYDYKYQLEAPKNVVFFSFDFYLQKKIKGFKPFKL